MIFNYHNIIFFQIFIYLLSKAIHSLFFIHVLTKRIFFPFISCFCFFFLYFIAIIIPRRNIEIKTTNVSVLNYSTCISFFQSFSAKTSTYCIKKKKKKRNFFQKIITFPRDIRPPPLKSPRSDLCRGVFSPHKSLRDERAKALLFEKQCPDFQRSRERTQSPC